MLANPIDPDVIEPYLLSQAQAQCPVAHYFGPGVYIREVTIPAGAYALGNRQKHEHLNIVIKGKVAMIDEQGVKTVEGPAIFTGKPGRKLGYVLEDCVWQNIYPNPDNCRDIETLEDRWTEKSEIAKEFLGYYHEASERLRQDDRKDYANLLAAIGMTEDQVRQESEITQDMVDLPDEYMARLTIRKSPIEGKGLFLSASAKQGEFIAPARIDDCRTVAGRYVNHAANPNCHYVKQGNVIYLVALRDINGCAGGHAGEELTVNYLDALQVGGRIEVTK